jgi:hypothetical protein
MMVAWICQVALQQMEFCAVSEYVYWILLPVSKSVSLAEPRHWLRLPGGPAVTTRDARVTPHSACQQCMRSSIPYHDLGVRT